MHTDTCGTQLLTPSGKLAMILEWPAFVGTAQNSTIMGPKQYLRQERAQGAELRAPGAELMAPGIQLMSRHMLRPGRWVQLLRLAFLSQELNVGGGNRPLGALCRHTGGALAWLEHVLACART